VYRCMATCFELSQPDKVKVDELAIKGQGATNIGMKLQSAKNLAKLGSRLLQQRGVWCCLVTWTVGHLALAVLAAFIYHVLRGCRTERGEVEQ
jgi:hypothetical protein